MSHPISSEDDPLPTGSIDIADAAIISVIRDAALSSYGVIELGPRRSGSMLRRKLSRNTPDRGIAIERDGEHLEIELSVLVQFGTPIFTVAQNIMQTVKFQVETLLGLQVDRVNVNVDGLRVNSEGGESE